MLEIRNHFYRVSIKALVLNETRDKFLVIKGDDGAWSLPGGGLEWGVSPQEDIKREIAEEMGVPITWVANRPSYFFTCMNGKGTKWLARVVYEVELEHLNFTPSEECVELRFMNVEEARQLEVPRKIIGFIEQFNSENHRQWVI